MSKSVTIIDYGVGNLLSVRRALEACDVDVKIVNNPQEILKSDRLILPGVGAFGNCINQLRDRELENSILEFIKLGRPILGICVGMQILLDVGEEFGLHNGLGIIPGKVIKINSTHRDVPCKVPFVGWSKLIRNNLRTSNIFDGIKEDDYFYLVHSFKADVQDKSHSLAHYPYCGIDITALINKDNVYGCQFHPEKSGRAGLKFLQNFLNVQ